MIEKYIAKYAVFLLYIFAFFIIIRVSLGNNILLNLIGLINLFIIFTNLPTLKKDKTGLIKVTVLYVIMILLYENLTPHLPDIYNPYNPLFYYLFAITGLSYWILGRKGYNVFSLFNVKLISLSVIFLSLISFFQLYKAGGVSNLVNGEDDYMFYYQVLPYLFLWLSSIVLVLNVRWQFVVFALFTIFIFLSTKRGPLVSFILGYIAIFLIEGKISFKSFFKYGLIVLLFYIVINYVSADFVNEWLERVNTDETDDISNGRDMIWGMILLDFYNSDFVQQLFGHGHEASHYVTGRNFFNAIGSHNDFIEVLYNMGVIGLIVFLSMIFMWCKCLYIGIKTKYQYTFIFAYLIVCFVLGSYVSSNMTRYATTFFGAFFYYYAGLLEFNINNKNGKN